MQEDYMHIIYDIKNKIASELAGFGFWQLKLTAPQPVNCAKWFLKISARLATVLLNNLREI